MEIATAAAHRALKYVDAVNRHGATLTPDAFEAYMRSPTPLAKTTGGFADQMEVLLRAFQRFETKQTLESTLKWLTRVQWLEEKDGHVEITRLGRAVLEVAEEGSALQELPVELVLDREDVLAYPRLLGTIAQAGDAALVDPYLSLEGFWDVAHRTSVTRILIGPASPRKAELGAAMKLLTLERSFALRASKEFHDRFVIPKHGSVRMVGTSLSGVGRKLAVSVLLGDATSDAVRSRFEEVWGRAEPLEAPERPAAP